MHHPDIRAVRRLRAELNAAVDELDLPLTVRQVTALAELTSRKLARPAPGGDSHQPSLLTDFEQQVLAGVAAGLEYEQIAAWQGKSWDAIRAAVRRLVVKLGTPNRVALAVAGVLGGHVSELQIADAARASVPVPIAATFSEEAS